MPDALVDAVAAAARDAGRLALDRTGTDYRRWEKAPGHPVCEIDLAVDVMLKHRLRAIDPEAGWLSEETADDPARLDRRRVWVVDPIDGTRDYLRGRSGWCVSIALVEEGRLVLGVLEAPALGQTYVATVGGGAWRNGAALHASDRTALSGARVPTDTLPKGDDDLVMVGRPNSIALRMAMVAADEADLCATIRWGHEWDIAAAALIVTEAGGCATDVLGRPVRYNSQRGEVFGVLASAPGLHTLARDRLEERADAAFAR
ncbi:3'(2'),5'-bisphosphate nucleotidase CysQ [Sphingomonas nostoxanthinifaciens]|uniref:3'(2'),5'-bisphosphate nucleotidase CysQ n=1 Tax=Sphingomonas nostoxanthinifaciens TaxID=2872652 RepID=UPI001CC1FD3C|nr:3'(2'),5'-bisphosphate nucleotidase CysQ [Sphingomonas nostoxanthinifaciens]UAK23989.1 3'(2'),5'-bisphosphate nucleotidase CysQ [Sphingomonas nostoxanthinifaciens]